MIEAPSFSSGSALLHGEEQPLDVGVERVVEVLLGADLKRRDLSYAGIGEHDVEAIEGFRYLGIEVVQVSHPTDIRGDTDGSPRQRRAPRRRPLPDRGR